MRSNPSPRKICNSIVLVLAMLLLPGWSLADARTDYLLNLLEKASNYRLRVQAATTLGKLRSKEAIPALVKATRDENELVVISAAIALKQIGDSSVVEELEKSVSKPPSEAARSQLQLTLQVLKSIRGQTGQLPATKTGKPRYLVRVDAMGNSSRVKQPGLTEYMQKLVLNRIRQEGDVIVQSPDMTTSQVQRKIKKEKLVGYIISGSIIRLDRNGNQLSVKLGLNVFTNPDYSLLMMPTTEATVRVGGSALKSENNEQEEIEGAIKTVADSLVTEIFRNLRQMEPQ